MDRFADACNYALQVARREKVWNKFALQRAVYRELRERFGLSANLAVRAIARVGKRKGRQVGGFKGIGSLLLKHLSIIARAAGFKTLQAFVMSENQKMLEVFSHSGLPMKSELREGTTWEIVLALGED